MEVLSWQAKTISVHSVRRQQKKAIKFGGGELFCQVSGDGCIYVGSPHVVFKMAPVDYEEIIRPLSCCDPGAWTIDKAGRREGSPDLKKVVDMAENGARLREPLEPSPLLYRFAQGKTCIEANLFYSPEGDFASAYNQIYIDSFDCPCTLWAPGPKKAAIVRCESNIVGVILPIYSNENHNKILSAVRAWFSGEKQKAEAENIKKNETFEYRLHLRDVDINRKNSEIESLKKEAESLRAEIDNLMSGVPSSAGSPPTAAACGTAEPGGTGEHSGPVSRGARRRIRSPCVGCSRVKICPFRPPEDGSPQPLLYAQLSRSMVSASRSILTFAFNFDFFVFLVSSLRLSTSSALFFLSLVPDFIPYRPAVHGLQTQKRGKSFFFLPLSVEKVSFFFCPCLDCFFACSVVFLSTVTVSTFCCFP